MRMIFEKDIEGMDFLEFIISPKEAEEILEKGIVHEFIDGLNFIRRLNVFIRVSKHTEDEDATSERKSRQNKKRLQRKHKARDGSRQAPKTSRGNCLFRGAPRKKET